MPPKKSPYMPIKAGSTKTVPAKGKKSATPYIPLKDSMARRLTKK